MSIWHSLAPRHYVALALILLLIFSAIQRFRTDSPNRDLLWANIIVPITLIASLPPVYYALDPLLGNINLVNLLSHMGIVLSGWLASRALGKLGAAYRGEPFTTRWFSPIWLVLILGILTYSFIQLGIVQSNRGLDAKINHPLYGVYHGVTFLGLAFGMPYVSPRLRELIRAACLKRHKAQFVLFYIGYFSAIAAGVLQLVSPYVSQVRDIRELFVYLTGFTLTIAFVMVTLDKKSLAQSD